MYIQKSLEELFLFLFYVVTIRRHSYVHTNVLVLYIVPPECVAAVKSVNLGLDG